MFRLLVASLLSILTLSACDAPGPLKAERNADELFAPSESNTVVVDAILIVDRPLPYVDLRRAAPPGSPYSAAEAALTEATVSILNDEEIFDYEPDPAVPGRYQPVDFATLVTPGSLYQLRVLLENDPEIRATTVTPPRVRIEEVVLLDEAFEEEVRNLRLFDELGETVYDAAENQIEFGVGLLETRLQMQGKAASFQFGVMNLESASPLLIDSDFFVDDQNDLRRDEASPLLRLEEGALFLPWNGIYYAGRHKVRLYAVDQNWFDLVRTDNVDSDREGGQTGQSFQRPLFNIDNGIGLFASASVDSFGFFVRGKGTPACTGCQCWGCGDRSTWSGLIDLKEGSGRIRYDRDVGTGATCELSYEIADLLPVDPCVSCEFALEFEVGELTVYDDDGGACEDAEDLQGERLRFGQGSINLAAAGETPRFALYGGQKGIWGLLEQGWSLVVSTATERNWIFGFSAD
jgi:hypothetical protein